MVKTVRRFVILTTPSFTGMTIKSSCLAQLKHHLKSKAEPLFVECNTPKECVEKLKQTSPSTPILLFHETSPQELESKKEKLLEALPGGVFLIVANDGLVIETYYLGRRTIRIDIHPKQAQNVDWIIAANYAKRLSL